MNKYAETMNAVIHYIYKNLGDELSLETLSDVAHFSRFHFHRQFSAYTGVNVYKFVQLLRLKRASYQLAFHADMKIIDIALDAGFENPESFSRAFKKLYNQTPSGFRNKPQWQSWLQKQPVLKNNTNKGQIEMNVEIVNFNETKIAVKEHKGAVELLNDSVAEFIEWRKSTGHSPVKTSKTFGIAYDDPKTTEPEDFRFDICGSTDKTVAENPQNVVNKAIPGGRCAKIRHLGSHDHMDEKIYYLYGQWLPESDEELRDFPCFFEYLNLFPEVSEHELITDIYLPLKDKS